MIVYIVLCGDAYDNSIDKVFIKKEDADDYVKSSEYLFIEEHEVIE